MAKVSALLSLGFATLCVADVQCKESGGQTCSNMMLQTSSQVGSSLNLENPCASCSACVAVPKPSQGGVTDGVCAACALGAKTWWPCNANPFQCQCGSEPNPTPSPTLPPQTPAPTLQPPAPTSSPTAETPAPTAQPPAPTPIPTSPPVEIVTEPPSADCTACDKCVAIPGNSQSANDGHCGPCARGGQSWWPCNVNGLCSCAGSTTPTMAPASTPSPTPVPPTPPDVLTPSPTSSTGQSSISDWFTNADFEEFFPNINTSPCTGANFFTHEAFLEAAAAYPSFASSGDATKDKRELAAFLGQTSHETTGGWATAPGGPFAWGYCWKEEVGCEAGGCSQYCQASNSNYPCTSGQTYQGRGPMQLSWNYNYGAFSEAAFGDKASLLNDPSLVARDPVVAYKAALWFWMTPQSPKPSCHAVMSGDWTPTAQDAAGGRTNGFGMTTNIINGGLECNQATNAKVEDRVGFYMRYASILGVSVDETTLYCDSMVSYR